MVLRVCTRCRLPVSGHHARAALRFAPEGVFPLPRKRRNALARVRARHGLAPTCDRDGVGARACLARSHSCQPGGSMGRPTAPARPVWMHGVGAPHAASANRRCRDDRERARPCLARSHSCPPGGSMGRPTAPARPVWMHGVGAPHAASANRRCRDDRERARPCLARSHSCPPGGSMGQPTTPARPVWMHGVGAPHAASANQRYRDDRRRARRFRATHASPLLHPHMIGCGLPHCLIR